MKKLKIDKEKVEMEFESFMQSSIEKCVRNATRKATAAENRNGGMPLETLDEDTLERHMATEDEYGPERGVEIEFRNLRIRLNDDLIRNLLENLAEKEIQALILRVCFGYDYEDIGRMLNVSEQSARKYKYRGLKKAKEKAKEYGRSED